MRHVASEHPFCVLIYMNSYIFHIYFISFISLSIAYLVFDVICLTLSLADAHGIAKYAHIHTETHTHTHTHTHSHTKKRSIKSRGKKEKKERGDK